MTLFAQRQRLHLPPARKQQNLHEILTHTPCFLSVDILWIFVYFGTWVHHPRWCVAEVGCPCGAVVFGEASPSCSSCPLALSPPGLSFAPKVLCWRLSPSLQPYSLSRGPQPDLNLRLEHGWQGLTHRPPSSSSTEPGCPVGCLSHEPMPKVSHSRGKK